MITPMNDEILKLVFVTSSARNTPEVDSSADDRMAMGAENVRNSNSQHDEDQHNGD